MRAGLLKWSVIKSPLLTGRSHTQSVSPSYKWPIASSASCIDVSTLAAGALLLRPVCCSCCWPPLGRSCCCWGAVASCRYRVRFSAARWRRCSSSCRSCEHSWRRNSFTSDTSPTSPSRSLIDSSRPLLRNKKKKKKKKVNFFFIFYFYVFNKNVWSRDPGYVTLVT